MAKFEILGGHVQKKLKWKLIIPKSQKLQFKEIISSENFWTRVADFWKCRFPFIFLNEN